MDEIKDWQAIINKPVLSSDEREIGIVSEVQPLYVIINSGAVTPNKYNVPKKFVNKYVGGTIALNIDKNYIEKNCKFE